MLVSEMVFEHCVKQKINIELLVKFSLFHIQLKTYSNKTFKYNNIKCNIYKKYERTNTTTTVTPNKLMGGVGMWGPEKAIGLSTCRLVPFFLQPRKLLSMSI